MPITRGFTGRGAARETLRASRRVSTTPGEAGLCSPRRPHRRLDTADVDVRDRRTSRHADDLDVGADPRRPLPGSTFNGDIHCVTTWSKLGMTFNGVSVDTLLAVTRPLEAATPRACLVPHRAATNLPAARRKRRTDVGGVGGVDGQPLASRPRRSRPPARPPPLFLEEREVGRRAPGPRPRRAWLLGGPRLPRSRRSLARAALPGRLSGE